MFSRLTHWLGFQGNTALDNTRAASPKPICDAALRLATARNDGLSGPAARPLSPETPNFAWDAFEQARAQGHAPAQLLKSEALMCPIGKDLLRRPVRDEDGVTFSEASLIGWHRYLRNANPRTPPNQLAEVLTSPMTRRRYGPMPAIAPNHAIDRAIDALLYDEAAPLHAAALSGDSVKLQKLLHEHGDDATYVNHQIEPWKLSPLAVAAKHGHAECVRLLLERDALGNLCDDEGTSPLLYACERSHYQVARVLLTDSTTNYLERKPAWNIPDRCAERETSDAFGMQPLLAALLRQDCTMVDILFEHGASLRELELQHKILRMGHTTCACIERLARL